MIERIMQAVEPRIKADGIFFNQTNRTLKDVDKRLGGNLIPFLDGLQLQGSGPRVLDMPCGTEAVAAAEIALRYPNSQVTAIDLDPRVESSRPNLAVVKGNAFDPDLKPGSFDIVYSVGLLPYYEDIYGWGRSFALLQKISGLLMPGGQALIDVSYNFVCGSGKAQEIAAKFGVHLEPLPRRWNLLDRVFYFISFGRWPDSHHLYLRKDQRTQHISEPLMTSGSTAISQCH